MTDWQLTVVTEINQAVDNANSIDDLAKVAMEVAMSTQGWVKQQCWPNIRRKQDSLLGDCGRPIMVLVDANNWIRADFSMSSVQAECVEYFMRRLRHVSRQVKARWVAVATDSRDNLWRRQVLPEYKQSRDERPSEIDGIARAVKIACEHMQVPYISIESHEADDIVASLATQCLCRGGRAVVCSNDKDYYQLVCEDVATWSKDKYHKPADIVEKLGVTAKQIVDYLCLVGKDDVPSCKGIGPKTAVELLQKHGDFLGIYDRKETLTPGKREAVEVFAQSYFMARQLHALKRDVDIEFPWDSTHCLD